MACYGLVGGLEHDFYDFPYIGNVIIPTDFHIFRRGRYTTNQWRDDSQGLHAEQDGRAEAVSRKWPLGIAVVNAFFFFRIQKLI